MPPEASPVVRKAERVSAAVDVLIDERAQFTPVVDDLFPWRFRDAPKRS